MVYSFMRPGIYFINIKIFLSCSKVRLIKYSKYEIILGGVMVDKCPKQTKVPKIILDSDCRSVGLYQIRRRRKTKAEGLSLSQKVHRFREAEGSVSKCLLLNSCKTHTSWIDLVTCSVTKTTFFERSS